MCWLLRRYLSCGGSYPTGKAAKMQAYYAGGLKNAIVVARIVRDRDQPE
jgi:hypothetical protein